MGGAHTALWKCEDPRQVEQCLAGSFPQPGLYVTGDEPIDPSLKRYEAVDRHGERGVSEQSECRVGQLDRHVNRLPIPSAKDDVGSGTLLETGRRMDSADERCEPAQVLRLLRDSARGLLEARSLQ